MTKTQNNAKSNAQTAEDKAKAAAAVQDAAGKPEKAEKSEGAHGEAAPGDQAQAAATTPADQPVADPFANLPTITVGEDDNVVDLTAYGSQDGERHADPRKYAKVHAEAVEGKLPIQRGWKHAEAVFVPGRNQGGENGFKPGSVYGTIHELVRRAGKQGVSAQELVTAVRIKQIGNKRSVYCNGLPPVGWAEGWLNSAVTKNIVGIHASRKAKPLTVAAKGTEATDEQNADAKKAANA
jgi:hypothetical protein